MDNQQPREIVERWRAGQPPTDAQFSDLLAALDAAGLRTEGGAYIAGSVTVSGSGAFVGRDQVITTITNTLDLDRSTAEWLLNRLSPPTRHTLRAPVGDFTGREAEIARLLEALQGNDQAGRVAMIRGMGGVGKTELALLVAHRLTPTYPDAQLLLELQTGEQALPPEALLAGIIRAFHPEARLPDELIALHGLYRQSTQGTRGLLVLDNASSATQIRPVLPPPSGWAVLVTSREHFPLPGALPLDLEVMDESEALELLARLLRDGNRPDVASHPDLGQLAALCGRLPLALRLAAGFLITSPNWTLERYLAALRENRLRRLQVGDESVARVLGVSVARLDEEAPALGERWRLLAVMPAPFNERAAAAVWVLSEEETLDTLTVLFQRSLLDYDRATQSYGLHDLLREYALADPPAGLPEARRRHAVHFLRIGQVADTFYELGRTGVVEGLRLFDTAWPHLLAAWRWMECQGDDDARRWVAHFPLMIPYVLDLRTTAKERLPLLQAAADAARNIGDRTDEAAALNNLGLVYASLGEVSRAIEFYEQYLEIAREIGDRQDEANALNNLGLAYASLGEVRCAIEFYEQFLGIAREIGDQRAVGYAFGNLGLAYVALGEMHRAIEFYEQHLEIAREIGDLRGEANTLGNLGNAYRELGEVRRAIESHEQQLELVRQIGDRQGEGNALGSLGNTYTVLGHTDQAIRFYEQWLEIAREMGDRRGEGNALGNLGAAYDDLGEVHRAIKFYEQHLEIAREIGDRRGEATAAWNLGLAYDRLGEPGRACELMQIRVDYEREIGHPNAEMLTARMEEICRKAAGTGS